jgi:uncharacterized CHY-type Zn-finger protein
MIKKIHGTEVIGRNVDPETRCIHWRSDLDIIAIKFACCGEWYSCYDCHSELAGHEAEVWAQRDFDEKAVLCGACGHQLTINEYLGSNPECPECCSNFNPGCAKHYHLYFEIDKALETS